VIRFPRTLGEAATAGGEIRAGGTDVQELRRSGVSRGPVVDLRDLEGLDRIGWDEGGAARIGALVKVSAVAEDERVRRSYPGLALAAGDLATPQIRAVGTVGGNLLQRNRCPYFRNPAAGCFKKGGGSCPAREGDHLHGVVFDLGPCVAPHPSTLGMVLLAYEAVIEVHGRLPLPVSDLYGDGKDPHHDHQLGEGELLTGVSLPEPVAGERAAYFRAISRAYSEWPLVECVARLVIEGGEIRHARVAVGGVANVPLRLPKVEEALVGGPANARTFGRAADVAAEGVSPLPMTVYKVPLLRGTVLETLERAAKGDNA
jgi:xanthine dehydrogenase YagS FAD-binding subunit